MSSTRPKNTPAIASPETSGIGFEDWLYNWAMYIRDEQDYSRDLTQASVTMHIRSRGVTVSDMVSGYGTRPETRGQWLQYDPNLDGEVHPLNIIGPAITTNKNACLQSNAEINVSSADSSAKHKSIAQKWERICGYLERSTWNEATRTFIFDDVQKGGTDLIDTYPQKIDEQVVPKIQNKQYGLALFQCTECNAAGMKQVDIVEDTEGPVETQMPCPECGCPISAVTTPIQGLGVEQESVPVYDIKGEVIPSFNFTIDDYGAKVGGLKTATWLQIQRLRDLQWMKHHFPNRTFTGPTRWSYPVRADYALSRGRWQYLNQQPRMSSFGWGHERYEVKEIYLHEEAYRSQTFPQDYEFIDHKGECTFRIKAGQTIAEAQEECYGANQYGFKFLWNEQTLLTICSPKDQELNLRDRFSDVHWSRESGAYRSAPFYSLVYIQDDITLINTLDHNITARNAHNPVLFDSLMYEQGDFQKEFVGTKNAALLPDFDIRKSVMTLPVPTPSPHLAARLDFLWGIKDSVSMVTPAIRGESQKGTPYAAQRQQLEQSYGNLTTLFKSFAQCKCDTFLNQAKLVKKFWTKEQFQQIGSMFDEIWTDEDVHAMCEIDLARDLIVSYREGSETPATPITKELKFFGALQQLGGVLQGLPPELALQIVTPEKWGTIIEKIGEFSDMDFDVSGMEIDEIIAQKRFIALARLCTPFEDTSFEDIQAMRERVVSMEQPTEEEIQQSIEMAQSAPDDPEMIAQAQALVAPKPITQFDITTEKIFHNSQIRFSKYEDLKQQQTFFIAQLNVEQGKPRPNEMLLAMLEVLLGLLEQAANAQQEEAMAKDPQIQAQQQQAAMEQAAMEAEQAAMEAEQAAQAQTAALEAAKVQDAAKFNHKKLELEEKKVDIMAQQADRDALLDIAKHSADLEHDEEGRGAETGEPAEDLIDKIGTNFKDLPPSAQVQVLADAGIKITKAEAEKHVKDSKPKPPMGNGKPAPKKKPTK